MRTFVLLACVCAIAQAQFAGSFAQSSSSFGNSRYSAQPTPKPQFGNQQQNQFQQSSFGSQQNGFGSPQNAFGRQQSSFGSQGQSQQQQASRSQNTGSCREKNERYPVSGSCDRYIECINGTAEEKLCPDGLRYNPDVNFNVYPCQYPNEVPCLERSSLQPPQPTAECEHQFGYQKLGDARNCSAFRSCVNGVAFDFVCPEGLAFSSESYRCEWPDEVADCDAEDADVMGHPDFRNCFAFDFICTEELAFSCESYRCEWPDEVPDCDDEAFLGFRCPEVPTSKELGPPAGFRFYRSDSNCQKYFICVEGRPRALTCGGDSAFDELTSTCVSADEVSTCPPELRAQAQRSRDEEQQRLAKQLKFEAQPPQQKRRF